LETKLATFSKRETKKFEQDFIPFQAKKVVSTASVWLWLEIEMNKIEVQNCKLIPF